MPAPLSVSPLDAHKLLNEGAAMVDIRESQAFAREHIVSSCSHPLNSLPEQSLPVASNASIVIFYCLSGMRTQQNAALLANAVAPARAMLMEGGINAWKNAGLPTVINRKQPIDIMRQVQIVAGALILCGVGLGYSVSHVFFMLSGIVGIGLLFAGVSGFCGMAKLLMKMPWNARQNHTS